MFQLFGTFRYLSLTLAALAMALAGAPRARAAMTPEAPIDAAGRVPDEIKNVGVTEHLGISLPLDARFLNERGEELPLRSYFGHGRPVVLQLGYFQCPMLCTLVSKGIIDSVKQVNLKAGTDFDMLFVSIDPSETPSLAALKHQSTMQYYGKPEEAGGFHFLVGRPDDIKAVTSTVGFRYEEMTDTQQFAHAAVLLIITPEGKVSRYLYGTSYPPQTVRLSLVEASANKIGTAMDQLILICLHYDAATGKYAWAAIGLLRIAGVLTLLGLGGTMFYFLRKEFHVRRSLVSPVAFEVRHTVMPSPKQTCPHCGTSYAQSDSGCPNCAAPAKDPAPPDGRK